MRTINGLLTDALRNDVDIVIRNVKEYTSSCTKNAKCIDTMVCELAYLLHKAVGNDTDALCEIMRALRADKTLCAEIDNEIYVKLLSHYLSLFGSTALIQTDTSFTPEASSLGRIAYVKNNFTEKAFWAFSSSLPNPKALYASSFENACEEVYNGVAQYCILPIENSADGKLIGFYSLIDKYDLKIFSVCNVDSNDSSSSTKFALLKRFLDIQQESSSDCKTFFEISYTQSATVSILDVLNASRSFGLHLIKIDSATLEYSDDQYKFYAVFSASHKQILDFLVFLYVYAPEFLPIGVYKYV